MDFITRIQKSKKYNFQKLLYVVDFNKLHPYINIKDKSKNTIVTWLLNNNLNKTVIFLEKYGPLIKITKKISEEFMDRSESLLENLIMNCDISDHNEFITRVYCNSFIRDLIDNINNNKNINAILKLINIFGICRDTCNYNNNKITDLIAINLSNDDCLKYYSIFINMFGIFIELLDDENYCWNNLENALEENYKITVILINYYGVLCVPLCIYFEGVIFRNRYSKLTVGINKIILTYGKY
jgi:hypothetical protein